MLNRSLSISHKFVSLLEVCSDTFNNLFKVSFSLLFQTFYPKSQPSPFIPSIQDYNQQLDTAISAEFEYFQNHIQKSISLSPDDIISNVSPQEEEEEEITTLIEESLNEDTNPSSLEDNQLQLARQHSIEMKYKHSTLFLWTNCQSKTHSFNHLVFPLLSIG